ncbi:hypothetical protein BGZ58_001807 [Dissophora ornata]|nr:hypothetical protein BGZ58_001807 [Dissophora ornata]
MSAKADCVLECTSISAKILFCGSVNNGFTNTMPTIGVDSQLDSCLCTQENVRLYNNCLVCENLSTAVNITNKFISDCKITNSSRDLVNGAFSRLGSLPSVATYVAAVMASLAMAATLGY